MKRFLPLMGLVSLALIYSCKKETSIPGSEVNGKLTNVKVPEGFTWESSRDVEFEIKVTDNRFMDAYHVIAVYDKEGKLLSKGSATINASFKTKIYLPATVTEVYVVKTAPDDSNVSERVTVGAEKVEISLGDGAVISSTKSSIKTLASGPSCTTGCTQSVSLASNYQWVTVDGGKTVCVNGSNKTFNVTFGNGGGNLRICGSNLTLQNINKNSGSSAISVVVTSAGQVNFPALDFDRPAHRFENYGICSFSGNLASSGTVENYGTLQINGDYNINSASTLTHRNESSLNVTGTVNVNSSAQFYNNGKASCKRMEVNSNSRCYNNCKLYVTDYLINDNILNNYGYIEVTANTQVNSGGVLNLYNGAILQTKNLDKVGGYIFGNGSTCLTKVTGTINSNLLLDALQMLFGAVFKGSLQVCYSGNLPLGLFSGGAKQECNTSIPTSGCNPGNGTAQIADTDGDGVKDNLDDYPNDASKAFNNYYPGAGDAGATIAFEDMWPLKGDYDMNDVVMSYNLKVITNAANKVVAIDGTYNLNARGGIFLNGFGIEFPVSPSQIVSVSGGTLEEDQEKATIILFNNMQNELAVMNTRKVDPVVAAKAYPLSITITNGPLLSDFGLSEYNPFIWNQENGRGTEIHLPGKTPTSLAKASLFGTGDDATNPAAGKYYVSADGFPWAISIPVKDFNYPIEGKDIASAYLKLPEWISSGGNNYKDWYSNQSTGYRNTANLFK